MAIYPELKNRIVAITGAAEGIGASTAHAFAEQGAQLALIDINDRGIDKVIAALSPSRGKTLAVRADVTDAASVAAAMQRITGELSGLDVLINCAGGYGRLATVEDMPLNEWDQTLALNLRSVFLVTKAAIPSLKQSKAGRIINVASISGRTVFANSSPAYGAAKAGVIQFTRFLAYQLGPAGITSNVIAPITTLTPRVAALRTKEDVERIAGEVPLRRLAVPEDHAQAMLFLASDGAAYLNGVTLDINGGRVMM
ncbi:MAG: SDR family oxidoreductase [Betaproteobacteria bacterium]|nr:SDR family oxidoreductase [Betaproteobacteria bacterium]